MKQQWRKVLSGVLAAGCIIGVVFAFLGRHEPTYLDKPLSYWLPQLLTNNRPQAESAFQEFGTNALRFLQGKIRSEFTAWRIAYRAAWPKFPAVVQQCLTPPRSIDDSWEAILRALKALGPASLPAMTDWLHHRDSRVRLMAILVIRDIDPVMWPNRTKVVQSLVQAIRQKANVAEDVKGEAAWALGCIGPGARSTPYVRATAAIGLWRIAGETNVLPILVRELGRSPDEMTCRRIIAALGEMGEAAKSAIPVILARGINTPVAGPIGAKGT
jgi:hypothetical protein